MPRPRKVTVAGSLPPLFGSYRPDLFIEKEAAGIAEVLIAGLTPHVDVWLAETQGSIAEAAALRKAIGDDKRPFWVSFTLEDGANATPPQLRSHEPVEAAVRAALDWKAEALLFNCSQPEVMGGRHRRRAGCSGRRIADPRRLRQRLPAPRREGIGSQCRLERHPRRPRPASLSPFVQDWRARGAGIVGGCCGIGPEHIAEIRKAVTVG